MNRTETRKAIVACESALVYVGPIAEDNYMANPIYNSSQTGLLRVDPYNDFLSAGGKIWDRVKQVADEVNLLDNLRSIVAVVRRARIRHVSLSSLFLTGAGNPAITRIGLIPVQPNWRFRSGTRSPRELGAALAHTILTTSELIAALDQSGIEARP